MIVAGALRFCGLGRMRRLAETNAGIRVIATVIWTGVADLPCTLGVVPPRPLPRGRPRGRPRVGGTPGALGVAIIVEGENGAPAGVLGAETGGRAAVGAMGVPGVQVDAGMAGVAGRDVEAVASPAEVEVAAAG